MRFRSTSTIITGFAVPLTFRATQDREQLFHDLAKRSKKHLVLAIRWSNHRRCRSLPRDLSGPESIGLCELDIPKLDTFVALGIYERRAPSVEQIADR